MRAILSKFITGSVALAVSSEIALSQAAKSNSSTGPTVNGFMSNVMNWLSSHRGAAGAILLAALFLIGFTIYNRKWPSN